MTIDYLSLGVVGGILLVLQVGIFSNLPRKLRKVMVAIPILGASLNWLISGCVFLLSGAGNFISICNIFSSILFGLILYAFKYAYNLKTATFSINKFRPELKIIYNDGREE